VSGQRKEPTVVVEPVLPAARDGSPESTVQLLARAREGDQAALDGTWPTPTTSSKTP
jgi:hypothetical protein